MDLHSEPENLIPSGQNDFLPLENHLAQSENDKKENQQESDSLAPSKDKNEFQLLIDSLEPHNAIQRKIAEFIAKDILEYEKTDDKKKIQASLKRNFNLYKIQKDILKWE